IDFGTTLKKDGLEFFAKDGLKTLTIPDFLKDIAQAANITLPDVGSSAIKLTGLFLNIGKELSIRAEAGFGFPEKLNEALGFEKKFIRTYIPNDDNSLVRGSISIGTDGIKGNILNSPFEDIEGITVENDIYTIDLDKLTGLAGCGMFKLKKPEVSLDFKKGAFKLNGGYELVKEKGLAVPLGPLKSFMNLIQLPEIAKALPAKVSITEIDFTPTTFKKLLDDSGVQIPKELNDALGTVTDYFEKLPPRLKDYFKVRLPDKLDFALNVTPDGGVSFNLETKGAPIQLLLPTPAALVGYQISRIDFGTAFGGALLKLEISARMDAFDYISLASALFLYDVPELVQWMPPREILGRSFEIKDLVFLIVYQAGIPIPIPVFYKTLALTSVGPEGVMIDANISFPKPEVNLMKVLKIIGELKNLFTNGTDLTVNPRPITFAQGENFKEGAVAESEMNLTFNAGPLYVRLPKWIATEPDPSGGLRGYTLGVTGKYQLLNVLNFAAIMLNSIHHLFKKESDSSYFLKSFDIKHRTGAIKAQLLSKLDVEGAWIAATPKEFASTGWPILSREIGEEQAKKLLTVIPVGDKFLLDGQDDKSTLIFLHGKLKIANAFEASATGGFLFSSSRAGIGLRLAGQVGNNTFTWLLQGAARIDKTGFLLSGKAAFTFLQFNLFEGEYLLTNDRLRITMNLGDANLPISLSGELNGEFRTGLFKLNGSGKLRFFGLEASGSHNYHFDETTSLIEHKGKLALGALANFELELVSQTNAQQFLLLAHLKGEIFNILKFDFLGSMQGNQQTGLVVSGKNTLALFGKNIIDTTATWKNGILEFSHEMNLFPGLESFLVMKNDVTGKIGREIFELQGDGFFKLGPLDLDTSVDWKWTPEGYNFRTQLKRILGEDVWLTMSSENGEAKFNGEMPKAVKLFRNTLQISAASNPEIGPVVEMRVKENALQYFYFDGAFNLLGISAAAQMKWENQQFELAIMHKMQAGSIFKADYQLLAYYSPRLLHVKTNLELELDLKPIFDFLGHGIARQSKVTFSVKNLSLKVEKKGPPDPQDDPELRERLRQAKEELKRLREMIKEQTRRSEAIIAELERYRAYASRMQSKYKYDDPKQRDRWDFWEAKFQTANQIRSEVATKQQSYTEHVIHHAELVRATTSATATLNQKIKQRDEFNTYFEHMWYASKCWKHPHEGDGRSWQEFRRVYGEVLEPKMREILTGLGTDYIARFIGRWPHDNTHTLADFYRDTIVAGWHNWLDWQQKQSDALAAKKITWDTLNQFVEDALVHETKTIGYRDHAATVTGNIKTELDALTQKGEGFLLVAQVEEQNHIQSDLLTFNIEKNGMDAIDKNGEIIQTNRVAR
ncbi:MAG: hypothetical protein ACRCYO_16120, partial [Bacteroidia bacterium]